MANATLQAIQTKVRRLTRSPSPTQLSDADINEYINTFVLYDFPQHLRLFNLRSIFTFYLEPNVDFYNTYTTDITDQLYQFKNLDITVHGPVYIAGRQASISQSREQFYSQYPLNNSIVEIATGDGITTAYAGTLSQVPVLRNQVLFSAIDTTGDGLSVYDDGAGNLTGDVAGLGTINYVTGAYSFTFSSAPAASDSIKSQTVPYVATTPTSMLFFDGAFYFRPVPDQPYRVEIEVYKQPTELLQSGDEPLLAEWWQYIAYGAAKKVFEDRTDIESAQNLMPEFKQQELLVLRRTIVQQTKERVATIYTDQAGINPTSSGWNSF